MLRRNKLHCFLAFAILASLLAGLITYRYLPRRDRPPVGPRAQNEAAMSPVSTHPNPGAVEEQGRLSIEVGYGNLPLSFERNRGQTDPRVKFFSRAGNRTLWLTADEAVLAVGRSPQLIGPHAKKAAASPLSAINVNLPIAGGTHRLTVQALDTASAFFKKTISINVSPH